MRTAALVFGLAAVGLAGCGGGGGSKTSASAVPVVTMDYRFQPATLNVTAGQKVTLEITNQGSVEHNFSVDAVNVSKDIEKGGKETVTFTAPSSSVEFYCKYHRDSQGMKGTLQVAGSSPASTTGGSGGSTSGY